MRLQPSLNTDSNLVTPPSCCSCDLDFRNSCLLLSSANHSKAVMGYTEAAMLRMVCVFLCLCWGGGAHREQQFFRELLQSKSMQTGDWNQIPLSDCSSSQCNHCLPERMGQGPIRRSDGPLGALICPECHKEMWLFSFQQGCSTDTNRLLHLIKVALKSKRALLFSGMCHAECLKDMLREG